MTFKFPQAGAIKLILSYLIFSQSLISMDSTTNQLILQVKRKEVHKRLSCVDSDKRVLQAALKNQGR